MAAVSGAVLVWVLLLPVMSAAQTRVTRAIARAPLAFEENRGQTDPRVRFLARGKGYTLFLTGDGAAFDLASDDRPGTAFRMTLDGARPAERISGVDPLPGRSHYFRGSDARRWTTGIPTYGKVRYESVYRGIDLVYYGNQQQFVAKIGEPSCGTDVTGQLDVLRSPVFPLVVPFSLPFAVVWNRTASPVAGPIAYVMHDMQNGIYLGPQRTRCFSVDGDQLTPVPLGGDAALAPGQAVFMGLVFFQTPGAAISYTTRLLSGPRNR